MNCVPNCFMTIFPMSCADAGLSLKITIPCSDALMVRVTFGVSSSLNDVQNFGLSRINGGFSVAVVDDMTSRSSPCSRLIPILMRISEL